MLAPNFGGSVINGAVAINASWVTFNIDDQSTSTSPSTINAAVAITGTTLYIRSQNAAHTLSTSGEMSGGFSVRVFDPSTLHFLGEATTLTLPA